MKSERKRILMRMCLIKTQKNDQNWCEILVQIANEKANQNTNYVHEDGNLSVNSTKKEERAIAKTNRKRVKKVST